MPTGTQALKDLVLNQLSQIDLSGEQISSMGGWDGVSTELLNMALNRGVVTEVVALQVIHERLLTLGAQAFDQHAKTGTPPDHVTSPHALAYAIRHEVLTPKQLKSLRFDRGENVFTFMEGEVINFTMQVLQKLKSWVDLQAATHCNF
ncbi:MAG: hypothetical protein RLZZ480_703 [Candidatus Parcubacteria bacterium]|jgi:hypothetical protein